MKFKWCLTILTSAVVLVLLASINSVQASKLPTNIQKSNVETTGEVIVQYLDENGAKVASDTHLTGKIGTNYETSPKTVNQFKVTDPMPNNAKGVFPFGFTYVTYRYTRLPGAKTGAPIYAIYRGPNGQVLGEDWFYGNIGDKITIHTKRIPGYISHGSPTEFTFSKETHGVIYGYIDTFKTTVTAKYVDDKGNKLADDVTESGYVYDKYTTDKKSIDGYTFKEVQGNASGIFTETDEIVTYVYTKNANPTPTVGGNVTVKYVDENGNKIGNDVVKTGNIGDAYTTEQKAIDGYTFKEVQGNTTGKFADSAQTVTYVYTKNANPTPVVPNDEDKTNNKAEKHSNHVQKSADTVLPKTSAEKAGELVGYIVVIAALVGLSVFDYKRRKQRKNKDN